MEEFHCLKLIFGDMMSCKIDAKSREYKLRLNDTDLEFICSKDYPNTIPSIIANISYEGICYIEERLQKCMGTPMIYDAILAYVEFTEKVEFCKPRTVEFLVDYGIEEKSRVDEDFFRKWKAERIERAVDREKLTGKVIFLKKRNNKEDVFDEEM